MNSMQTSARKARGHGRWAIALRMFALVLVLGVLAHVTVQSSSMPGWQSDAVAAQTVSSPYVDSSSDEAGPAPLHLVHCDSHPATLHEHGAGAPIRVCASASYVGGDEAPASVSSELPIEPPRA